jgi:hypothetical protein
MECVDFIQPRWPSRISTSNSIFSRSFRFGTGESGGISYETLAPENIVTSGVRPESPSLVRAPRRPTATDLRSETLNLAMS